MEIGITLIASWQGRRLAELLVLLLLEHLGYGGHLGLPWSIDSASGAGMLAKVFVRC